ncbi:pseudouridine synthase [Blattabacterium cuenoti]|uniref:pseudouridine synthase n=1 Tax=Blattabacterium cuenoti TaxID=1653831 RepID=UPI00163BFEBE|nr:pseudouridine synthase [Blattabacterium cuenoti]
MFTKQKKIRLNHFLSCAGISSRRKSDLLIQSGSVEVNGKIITKLGTIINTKDIVKFNGETIKIEKKIYLLIDKPKGFITTTKDQFHRKTVMNLIPHDLIKYRLFPVGRLDRLTTGLLLLTNDGQISEKLTHPKHRIQKIYRVLLNQEIESKDIYKIKKEKIFLKEGRIKINFIYKGYLKNEIKIGLYLGWNKIIKRIFKKLNYDVIQLDRINFGGLTRKHLKKKIFIRLSNHEVINILNQNFVHEKNNYH